MGYYIPNDEPITAKGAVQTELPKQFNDIPSDKALIVEVDNGPFKANGLIYSQRELEDFTYPNDHRPKRWFLMDKEKAHKLSGYKQ